MTKIKTTLMGLAAGVLFSIAPAVAAEPAAAGHQGRFEIERQSWTWGGIFGNFDQQQLRRGFKVYKEVCSNCHNIGLLSYRNLGEPGGPGFSAEEVKAIAAEAQVFEGFDEQGNMAMRPGRPSDNFVWKFKNAKEASAAFGGAVPPDLSLITRARGIEREFSWYQYPLIMAKDLATQYQEQGADYVYALLNGYVDAPKEKQIAAGLNYNRAFPGNQLAMPQPLSDAQVDFADHSPNDLDHESRDVVAFLAWAAEPHLAERKQMGVWVIAYLAVLAGLLLISKKVLWRNIEH
jgi:ubiquinol-cytochrome c reductase cytochrome c1 subunit